MWDTHPTARQRWLKAGSEGYHRFGTHRRFCAFESPFDRFLYMDADTLLIAPVDFIFDRLNSADCVVYDFQHKDPTHVYEVASSKLPEVFARERIETEIFCSGFYASKAGLFDDERRERSIEQLRSGEAEILYPMAPDQTLINYLMMRSECSIVNLALELPREQRTGCCVTSPHFEVREKLVYDKGIRLTYLHYIGLSSSLFARLCNGENIDFPYRDIFLTYRYLHEPEKRPVFTDSPKPYRDPAPSLARRVLAKLGLKK
jgi:hypothetical protein